MLTVACVLKSGGIYDATWVARLRDGVKRHLPLDHRFVCLSDVDVPCERIPLEHDWPGWWSKIELFKLRGPVLFFDLDTAIVGDLSDIAGYIRVPSGRVVDRFVALRDFYRSDGIGSGVLGWQGRAPLATYKGFLADPDGCIRALGTRGDQGALEELPPLGLRAPGRCGWQPLWQDVVPGQIVSYKVHCRNGIPPDARVVCLHGMPKFGGMPVNDPVRMAWEMAT